MKDARRMGVRHFGYAGPHIDRSRQDEQQIGETVEIPERGPMYGAEACHSYGFAFGPAHDGAGQVEGGAPYALT